MTIELGQNQVTPLHLLAALLGEGDGIVVSVLEKFEIDYPLLLDLVIESLEGEQRSTTVSLSHQMFIAPELVKNLESAVKVSADMGDKFVSTEHLFISLLTEPGPNLDEILQQFDLDVKKIFDFIIELKKDKTKLEVS